MRPNDVDFAIDRLVDPEVKRLKTLITEIIVANNRHHSDMSDGYYFNNQVYPYTLTRAPTDRSRSPISLVPELIDQAELVEKSVKNLRRHKREIAQFLYVHLYERYGQDLRDAFPECMIRSIMGVDFTSLPRTRDIDKLINPQHRKSYERAKPLIEMYAALQLLN